MNENEKQFENFISDIKFNDNPDSAHIDKIEQRLLRALDQSRFRQRERRSIVMKNRIAKLALAAVIILAVTFSLHYLVGNGTNITFGQVLENLRHVQTLHAMLNQNDKETEVWAQRPNMLHLDHYDGTYEISNGPELWVVDEKNNKATRKPSWYFEHAQLRGLDVLDFLFQAPFTDDASGFFSEGPVEQIEQDGKTFDLYQMQTSSSGRTWEFEALVDNETQVVQSMTLVMREQNQFIQSFEMNVLEFDQPVPDNIFVFKPSNTMEVTIEKPDAPVPEPEQLDGSTLSGRITWANSGKPVVEARLRVVVPRYDANGRYQSSLSFEQRVETNREGYWQVNGVPTGEVDIRVRSWELEWPTVPTFTTYIGSPRVPHIIIDGQSDYSSLDFKVYKPEDLFSRIIVRVTNEDGNPVENASGTISYYNDPNSHLHQHLYADSNQQHTGPDGIFDARDIWPSTRPVRVCVGAGSPYLYRGTYTEPFLIKPKESYHFDIVLQHSVQMKIQAVNTENKPLEGVSVLALDINWNPFRGGSDDEVVLTDSDGFAELESIVPSEDMIIAIWRAEEPKAEFPRKTPLASLFIPSVAPSGPDTEIHRIVFDERPISIEVTYDSTFDPEKHSIRAMLTDLPRYSGIPFAFLKANFDGTGRFLLEAVPAGDIVLVCNENSDWNRVVAELSIRTEPGNTYFVKVGSRGLELIGQKPNF